MNIEYDRVDNIAIFGTSDRIYHINQQSDLNKKQLTDFPSQ